MFRSTPPEVKYDRLHLSESQRAFRRAEFGKHYETSRPGTAKSSRPGTATTSGEGKDTGRRGEREKRLKGGNHLNTEVTRAKRFPERCRSAPITTKSSGRPKSAFHSRCVETICNFHSRAYARQPYIQTKEEASNIIKNKIKQHKEVLVAVLDCSSVVPELFQRNLLTQEEVKKILAYETKQDQNRRVLSMIVHKDPRTSYNILEVIRSRQMIFKDMLEVPGLQQFISRCETEEWGKELQRTLKLLKMDPNAVTKRCPICKTCDKKKKRSHSAKLVSQVGRDFSNITLPTNKMPRPEPIPLTNQEKRRLLDNLETISEVSTTFCEDENAAWIRVLQAEPEIIERIYRET
ncbi:uncharacterized protein LOC134820017 [Bolinopsis microptera]|uniref:uncharacterized protein LOC134820017 n=1 Tax=Bolinopsis microptera TaxID=2820187 RepID=UPI003079F684